MEMDGIPSVRLDRHIVDFRRELLIDPAGKTVPLRAQSFSVLRFLCHNPNRVITTDELLEAVWPKTTVTEDSLVQCIGEIRRALEDRRADIIKTVPRRGYILNTLEGSTIKQAVDGAALQALRPAARHRRAKIFAFACAAMILPAAALLRAHDASHWRPSIVVTPFKNLTGDTRGDYLAYGFTEDLITDLGRYGDLLVIA